MQTYMLISLLALLGYWVPLTVTGTQIRGHSMVDMHLHAPEEAPISDEGNNSNSASTEEGKSDDASTSHEKVQPEITVPSNHKLLLLECPAEDVTFQLEIGETVKFGGMGWKSDKPLTIHLVAEPEASRIEVAPALIVGVSVPSGLKELSTKDIELPLLEGDTISPEKQEAFEKANKLKTHVAFDLPAEDGNVVTEFREDVNGQVHSNAWAFNYMIYRRSIDTLDVKLMLMDYSNDGEWLFYTKAVKGELPENLRIRLSEAVNAPQIYFSKSAKLLPQDTKRVCPIDGFGPE